MFQDKKILGINCDTSIIPNFVSSDFIKNRETIYEYDITFINLHNINYGHYWGMIKKSEISELDIFFENGGLCIVILPYSGLSSYYLSWCPFEKDIEYKKYKGTTFYNKNKEYDFLFNYIRYNICTQYDVYPSDSIILATNKPNNPIMIIIPYSKGRCVFLPYTQDLDTLFSAIYNNLDKFYPIEKPEPSLKPMWVNDFLTKRENELFLEKEKIESELGKYSIYKQLLWETGRNLEQLVKKALIELGVEVIELSQDSACDLEIKLGDDLIGVCEIKGLSQSANKDDIRQLLEYFIEQRDLKDRKVMGILIINHFKDIHPSKRNEPISNGAKEIIKRHNFKVITTIELYNHLVYLWQKKFSINEFLKSLRNEI